MHFQGCTSSLSLPDSFEKRPLSLPSLEEKSTIQSESDIKLQNCGGHAEETNTNSTDSLHVNHTQILVISRDQETCADSESIKPLFHTSEQLSSILRKNLNRKVPNTQCYNRQSNPGLEDNHRLPELKGVLKTSHSPRKSHSQMLPNQPIKTVTFMDSVTIVTVY